MGFGQIASAFFMADMLVSRYGFEDSLKMVSDARKKPTTQKKATTATKRGGKATVVVASKKVEVIGKVNGS
ncbi:hypothetical protein L6452_16606 [Arctium lappa]|uniref:Uncharacterized protein n=1 Tax=Arctium lappa TaxID=4217 RepID=A0ACB9C0Z7_ARCLA|nr:hypothetical protein L6452_16606 [Arctium lappa]